LKSVWIVFAVVAAVGFLLSWWEKEYKMRTELNTDYGLKAPKIMSISPKTMDMPENSATIAGCPTSVMTEKDGDIV
jgi:hypothetical protein